MHDRLLSQSPQSAMKRYAEMGPDASYRAGALPPARTVSRSPLHGKLGTLNSMPNGLRVQRARLEPPCGRYVSNQQTRYVPSRQANFVRLQRAEVDSRVALLAFEHLSDALIAGRIDELTAKEMRTRARYVVVGVRPQPVGRIERPRQIVEAQ